MFNKYLLLMVFPILLILLILVFLGGCELMQPDNSAEPSPAIIGDEPAVQTHTSQADIDAEVLELSEIVRRGQALMKVSFNTLDGAGRPETTGTGDPRERRDMPQNFNRISGPDASSCSGCHSLPRPGGGGDMVANVFVLGQRLPFANFDGGEGDEGLNHDLTEVGNERSTVGMFGSGLIELLAREMTADLHAIRAQAIEDARTLGEPAIMNLVAKGVNFGRITSSPDGSVHLGEVEGVDEDLIIKPFHQKGVVASLREFTVNAMNHHHGMQPAERFGDGLDPDGDGVVNEVTRGDITAITIFQATLPPPGRVMPTNPSALEAVEQGEQLFSQVGCAVCHVPALPLRDPVFTEPGPYNPPGNL